MSSSKHPGTISVFLHTVFCFVFFGSFLWVQGQDQGYARWVMEVLASDTMGGRGYRDGSDRRAAEFICGEFRRHGIKPIGDDHYHRITFPVNSITDILACEVDGIPLAPGTDFYISSRSKGRYETYDLVWLDKSILLNKRKLRRLTGRDLSGSLLVFDSEITADAEMRDLFMGFFWGSVSPEYRTNAAGIVICKEKPVWQISDGGYLTNYLVVTVRCGLITRESNRLKVGFVHDFSPSYTSSNVIGMIPGTVYPDSFIVFTGHYDHLGMMGDVVFYGANDNASGTAMVLDLARHYAANPPAWSVAFMAFTAEEAGLLGSTGYVEHPLFPLDRIRLLINLDMVGTGSEGITVVNGATHRRDFDLLDSINRVDSLLYQVKIRGASPNSDHHPFDQKGVKSFFIYTMGPEHLEYHNIHDRADRVPLTAYDELFQLLIRYTDIYMH
jgi:aminopeptidase YwaD